MKKLEEFITREVAGEYIMMPVGSTALKFNGLITGNAVSLFIWNNIEKVNNAEEMASLICEEFDIDYNTAKQDCEQLMNEMIQAKWIE